MSRIPSCRASLEEREAHVPVNRKPAPRSFCRCVATRLRQTHVGVSLGHGRAMLIRRLGPPESCQDRRHS